MLQIIQQYEHSVKFWCLEPDPGLNYAECTLLLFMSRQAKFRTLAGELHVGRLLWTTLNSKGTHYNYYNPLRK